MEKLYTVKEVVEIVKLHRYTIYRHIDEGLLKAVKIGQKYQVKESDLQEYLKGDQHGA